MTSLLRPLLIVTLVLALPLVPLAVLGTSFEDRLSDWIERDRRPPAIAAAVVGLLAADIVLPVPSSFVSTYGGVRLGVLVGTLASWTGMTLGAVAAYALARRFGRPVAQRFADAQELDRLERVACRLGWGILVVARPLPVVAEASVLLAGVARLPWHRFLFVVGFSNLGVSLVYAWFGHLAIQRDQVVPVLVASVALPLLATAIARRLMARELSTE